MTATPRFSAERPARLAVLISGRGSNMLALLAACRAPGFPARPALVLSNAAEAPGLAAAAAQGVETAIVDDRDHRGDKPGFEAALDAALRARSVDVICLAGFMRVLSAEFVGGWAGRILNVHPSLLPLFRGLDTHARALAAGVKIHGATVHLVTAELDGGPILAQAAIPVLADDTPERLAARLLPIEHALYPRALKARLDGAESLGPAAEPLFGPAEAG